MRLKFRLPLPRPSFRLRVLVPTVSEVILVNDRDAMKQTEETLLASSCADRDSRNLSDDTWDKCASNIKSVEGLEQHQVPTRCSPTCTVEVDQKRSCAPSTGDFLLYSIVIVACAFGTFEFFSATYPDQEVRDRLSFMCLPVLAEASFWLARAIKRLLAGNARSGGVGFATQQWLDAPLLMLPAVVACAGFILASPDQMIGFLVLAGMLSYQVVRSRVRFLRFSEFIEVPLAVALVWYAFSLMVLLTDKDPHHWAHYLGAAYAVVGGAHLLWDVPSQYGFLSTLSIATVARVVGVDVTTSMSFLVISMQLLGVLITFCVFRFYLRLTTLAAALCAIAVQLCLPGAIEYYRGPAFAPSTSAIRFLPALFALLTLDLSIKRPRVWSTVFASVCIAVASLWSPESCLYTAAPLGVYGFLSFVRKPRWAFFSSTFVRICTLSALLVGGFFLCYAQTLPSGVDLVSFYEYAAAYATSFGLVPIILNAWTGFFISCLALSYFVARACWSERGAYPAQGSLFCTYIFCIATYFIARSASTNVHNLTPWILTALGAISVGRGSTAAKARGIFTIAVGSLCVGLFLSLYSGDNKTRIVGRASMEKTFLPPEFDQVPLSVLEAARETVQSEQFTFVHGSGAIFQPARVGSVDGNVLPITPLGLFSTLPVERQRMYLRRMLNKSPRSYALCIERVCPELPFILENMKDFASVTEVPFAAAQGWKIFEISKR